MSWTPGGFCGCRQTTSSGHTIPAVKVRRWRKRWGPLLIGTDNTAIARLKRYAVTNFLCSYSRLILGNSNADALGLVDSKAFRALVVAVAGVNRALEYPRLVIPGATRRRERLGRRNLNELARRTMDRHNGDRTYQRHDRFGAAECRVVSHDSAGSVH